jgi:hypothetical protein
MQRPRTMHAASAINGERLFCSQTREFVRTIICPAEKVFVIGGYTQSDDVDYLEGLCASTSQPDFPCVEYLDVGANASSWATGPPLSVPLVETSAVVAKGRIYLIDITFSTPGVYFLDVAAGGTSWVGGPLPRLLAAYSSSAVAAVNGACALQQCPKLGMLVHQFERGQIECTPSVILSLFFNTSMSERGQPLGQNKPRLVTKDFHGFLPALH